MRGAKWLLGMAVLAGLAWKVGTDPRWLSVVLEVAAAVFVSWLLFVCIFYLTATHVRRTTQRTLRRAHVMGVRTHH